MQACRVQTDSDKDEESLAESVAEPNYVYSVDSEAEKTEDFSRQSKAADEGGSAVHSKACDSR